MMLARLTLVVICCMARPSSPKSLRLLSGISDVSDSTLSRVIAAIKKSPDLLSQASSTTYLHKQALAAAREVGTVKHTIALTNGTPLLWEVLAMQDLLPYLCNACPHFCQLLGEIYTECGADWRVILYCDGLTPGSVLAPENQRKSIIWYATILEFGSKMCHQELWFCLASIETAVSKLVPAQLSGLTRLVVRDMVCGDRPMNTVGIILPVGRERRLEMVRIHFHATLADEEALSAMLGLKGSSGIVPCAARCWCVGKEKQADRDRGIRPLTDRGVKIVDITCTKKADIVYKCDADVWADCDHLVSKVGDSNFAEIEMCIGINYHAAGILFDHELRNYFKPSTCHRFDPLHVIFSNGLLGSEIMLFMKESKQHMGVYFAHFREYAERVCWQSPGLTKPQNVFSPAREKSSGDTLKAGASELIAAYAVFRQWTLETFLDKPAMQASLRSLLLLLDVVDLVLKAATRRLHDQDVDVIATRLDTAAFAYLEAFVNAHGRAGTRHKHHELAAHLADQLRMDRRMLWCFTAERKHIVAKNLMQHSKNMRAFAFGTVARMLTAQICSLNEIPAWLSKLHVPEKDFPEFAHGCRMSKGMRWMDSNIKHGNPLFIGVGQQILVLVVACIAVDGNFGVLGHQCHRVRGGPYSSDWKLQPAIIHRALMSTETIDVARHWRFVHADCLTVLH
jgi:hypothetical protein